MSALTVALALTLVGLLAMTLFNANRLLHELGRQMTVSIYLQESTSEADIEALTRKVSARPGVKRVRTLTAVQDRERNKKLLDPALLAGLDEAAIPGQPVLQVELEESLGSRGEVEQLAVWTQSLKSVAAVDSAEFGADKLRVLAVWLQVKPQDLLFGPDPKLIPMGVQENVDSEILTMADGNMLGKYRSLPYQYQRMVREIVAALHVTALQDNVAPAISLNSPQSAPPP